MCSSAAMLEPVNLAPTLLGRWQHAEMGGWTLAGIWYNKQVRYRLITDFIVDLPPSSPSSYVSLNHNSRRHPFWTSSQQAPVKIIRLLINMFSNIIHTFPAIQLYCTPSDFPCTSFTPLLYHSCIPANVLIFSGCCRWWFSVGAVEPKYQGACIMYWGMCGLISLWKQRTLTVLELFF